MGMLMTKSNKASFVSEHDGAIVHSLFLILP